MPRRRRIQFLAEVVFLGGLAALAAVAHMRAAAVIGVMVFGWVVVALIEWSTWLDRPHFGRGLPPRYYLPQVSLPPPEPLAPAPPGRQPARRLGEGAETWVASPDWAEAFGEWPPVDPERLGEDTDLVAPGVPAADTVVAAAEARAGAERADPGELTELAEPPWLAPPLPSPEAPEPALPVAAAVPGARPGEVDDDQPTDEAIPLAVAPLPEGSQLARHRVDPFAPAPAGRLRRRREGEGVVEVPAEPPPDRPAPLAARSWRGAERG